DMRVHGTGGEDFAFTGDDLGAGPDDDRHAGLDVGVAGLADFCNAPVLQADIGLHDAPVIDDKSVGDDGVDGTGGARHLRLPHAVADDLAAAELHLFAGDRIVFLHLD